MMIAGHSIHGHAIVSDDDRIATVDGTVPAALRNQADWLRFQAALDQAAVTVLGRRGHEANPNRKHRNRLVVSAAAGDIERRADALWWNPAAVPVAEALARAAPDGGVAAVTGGRRVFDLFLQVGFDEFHLTRVAGVRVPRGIPLFSTVTEGVAAGDVLGGHGLVVARTEVLDRDNGVSLTLWRSGSPGGHGPVTVA